MTAPTHGALDHPYAPAPVVQTGPSGLIVGMGPRGPVTIRLFRSRPTRLVAAAPPYVTWLLAYRTVSLGAYVSLLTGRPRDWEGLRNHIQASGGTADLVPTAHGLPEAGRPYRPSLIVDDGGTFDPATPLGPWQALLTTTTVTGPAAIQHLRSADMGLIAPHGEESVIEAMRRAYFLNPGQVRACHLLAEGEVVLAMPRRLVRIAVRPTPGEHRLLFGS
ncbi:hypothetical protein [Granulicoccus phenolivorans]|uniref:hypothetical protein n=1 Tax=Granulicoccus phenolivorans TaxID=266854 RepID=UPI000411011E|nr:hypothetical protein [Granulicoccus phenolivorans]